jgi:hypothetical protein
LRRRRSPSCCPCRSAGSANTRGPGDRVHRARQVSPVRPRRGDSPGGVTEDLRRAGVSSTPTTGGGVLLRRPAGRRRNLRVGGAVALERGSLVATRLGLALGESALPAGTAWPVRKSLEAVSGCARESRRSGAGASERASAG